MPRFEEQEDELEALWEEKHALMRRLKEVNIKIEMIEIDLDLRHDDSLDISQGKE